MEIVFAGLQLAIIAFFALSPFLFYKKTGERFTKFYLMMAARPEVRLIYRFALGMLIFYTNIISVAIGAALPWHIPSLILSSVLVPERFTAAILRRLHDDKRVLLASFALFFGTLAFPQLFSLSFSIGMLMVGALFYPSWALTVYIKHYDELKEEMPPSDELIMRLYFFSKRAKGSAAILDP